MQKWSPVVALLAWLVSTSTAAQADGVVLQYRFDKEEPLTYRLDMKTNATFATPDGGVRKTSMANHMELKQELIEKKEDGSSRIAITILKATQTVDGKPVPVPIEPGHSILLTMKPNGEVADAASDLPAAQTQSQLQMVFPLEAVKKGTAWERETMIQDPLPLKAVTNYVVDELDAEFPGYRGKVVQIKSSMGMENEQAPTGEGITSKTTGQIWFDPAKGRIVKSKASSKFQLTIPIQLQNILPPNSNVKIDFDIDVDISLVQ